MANAFDQFDPRPAAAAAGAAAHANPFDRFDGAASSSQPDAPMTGPIPNSFPDGTPKPPIGDTPGGGMIPPQPVAAEPMGGAAQASAGLMNQLMAAFQNTTPVTHGVDGTPNYQSAGSLVNSDAGPMVDPGGGQPWQPIDPTKHVVLMDPKTGQPNVYMRSPDTDTNLPTSLGHLVGFGASAPSDIGAAAPAAASAAQARLADFEKSNVSPNLPAVTGNAGVTMMAQGAKNIPFAGAPIVNGIQNNVAEIGAQAGKIADSFGTADNAETGGEALQQGSAAFRGDSNAPTPPLATALSTPTRDVGFVNKAAALYDAIPIPADAPAQVSNTVAQLNALKTNFASNPELGAALQNPAFAKFAAALTPRTEQAPDVVSPILDASGKPIVTPGAVTDKGGLSWDDLKNFRTFVGQQINQPIGELGMGRDVWKGLYGAISDDMNATAQAVGGGAIQAFNRANNYYSAGLDRINGALSLVDKAASPENAFARLSRTASERMSGADVNTLQQTMRSMPQEQRDNFTSAIINRLGLPTKGAAGANPSNFSVGSFVSNYADLSDHAKDIMFGTAGTPQRDALESLANVATGVKNVERLGNPSGTARNMIAGGMATAEGAGLFTNPAEALHVTAATMIPTYLGSAALMSPRITRWYVGTFSARTPQDIVSRMTQLKGIAASDESVRPFFDAMSQAVAQQQQSQPQGVQSPGGQ